MITQKSANQITAANIMAVGDIDKALSYKINPKLNIRRVNSLVQAVSAAARFNFDTILIVLADINAKLEPALEMLAQSAPKAAIYLAAQMHEEPYALNLTKPKTNKRPLAHDYFIVPVDQKFVPSVQQPDTEPSQKNHTQTPQKEQDQKTNSQPPLASLENIQKLYTRIFELENLATTDDLTGLKNRRYVREFLKQMINRAQADNLHVTLLVFDIDNFKHYNDTFGHVTGDKVLIQTAAVMKNCFRKHDCVARIGGDEFAVIFWDQKEPAHSPPPKNIPERRTKDSQPPKEVISLSERFRAQINDANLTFLGKQGKGSLSISGGLADFPRDGQSIEDLFNKADQAMIEAKRNGKNQIYIVGKKNEQTK
jgi:GGDEF domain-containing protein